MSKINTISQLLNMLRHGYTVVDGELVNPRKQLVSNNPMKAEHQFVIELAGFSIRVNSMYAEVYDLCKDYLSNREPQISVAISEDDIAYERAETDLKNYPSDSYVEVLTVYRKISEALIDYDTLLMHGAVVAYNGNAYMFTANSGTGKTTHVKKWLDCLPDAFVVNGDKPLVRIENDRVLVCGTPWCGKEQMNTNTMVPLKAIVLMERSPENIIKPISFGEAFVFLLQQTYRPNNSDSLRKTISLLTQLSKRMSFYKYSFNNLKSDCFEVAYNALVGREQ